MKLNNYLVLSFGMLFSMSAIIYGLMSNKKRETTEINVVTSKCDSLYLVNDSLSKRLEIAERRMQQYKIGLWFLRDKDKKAYDYVINAGNLQFDNSL